MPKFSIITPSFNQAAYLEETILSVINQNYKDFEYIIIDGGSEDGSREIIKKYEKHLAYWVSVKDSGQSEAINKGLRVAKGTIITWLNSDDVFEPRALERAAAMFDDDSSAFAIHGKSIVFGEGIKDNLVGPDEDLLPHEYLPFMRFPQPSSFFRKEVFDACQPLDEALHYSMDFELVVKAVLLGYAFKRSNIVFSRYRLHNQSKSNHDMRFLKEWEVIVTDALAAINGGTVFREKLLALGIGSPIVQKKYNCNINLVNAHFEEIMLEHLHLQYHFHYREGNLTFCLKLSAWLKVNYAAFHKSRQFSKFNFRLKFVPKWLLEIIRKVRI